MVLNTLANALANGDAIDRVQEVDHFIPTARVTMQPFTQESN